MKGDNDNVQSAHWQILHPLKVMKDYHVKITTKLVLQSIYRSKSKKSINIIRIVPLCLTYEELLWIFFLVQNIDVLTKY
jgi:hypothetical protein